MARQRKRSIRGSGSVFQRKDGRWEAKFKVEETGKYKSLYAPTEKEAYKKLQDALHQQKQGTLATGPDQTVGQFLLYWLEDVEKPTVRLSTYLGNRIVIRKHLIPGVGHLRLQKLTARNLQSFYAEKLRKGTSESRIVRFNAVMHKALDHAKRLRLVGSNIARDVELPKQSRPKYNVLTPDQARLLLQTARKRDLDVLLSLAVITAMRVGEILSLRWSDIDIEKGELHISRNVGYFAHYRFVEGDTKTGASERRIKLPKVVQDMLSRYYTDQLQKRLNAGVSWVDLDLVFCDKKGGYIVYTTLIRRFYKVLAEAGLPKMRFHELRHSAATILFGMGVPANVVQELLGHSDIKITLGIYGHVLPSMRLDASDKMDDVFGE